MFLFGGQEEVLELVGVRIPFWVFFTLGLFGVHDVLGRGHDHDGDGGFWERAEG